VNAFKPAVKLFSIFANKFVFFVLQVKSLALSIEDAATQSSKNIFGVLETMALTISSHAKTTEEQWPLETFPNFEPVAGNFRDVSGTRLIAFTPYVEEDEISRDAWEAYATQNQGWIKEGFAYIGEEANPLDIPETIWEYNRRGQQTPSKTGPFVPLWQTSSPPVDTGVVNFNLLSNVMFHDTFFLAYDNKEALLSQVVESDIQEIFGVGAETENPESLLISPIFEESRTGNAQVVVGAVVAILPWDSYFSGLLHEGASGMICVLSNTCDQAFTYKLDGAAATYMGSGDLHDSDYDDLVHVVEVAPFTSLNPEKEDKYCEYTVYIYPTSKLEDEFRSAAPGLYMGAVFLIFLVAACLFLTYDYLVQKRQRKVMDSAARSNAIVSSLFPAEIRDRLFKGDEEGGNKPGDHKKVGDTHAVKALPGDSPQKYRLKNYLNEEDTPKEAYSDGDILESKPIADLFPNTTVMFADISGFTAWSSVREPSQVFTLLETVYKAFDTNAKRRRVFKVETVGDCYVAVTGLPEPNKDHAVVMCRFARECLTQFNDLASKLEVVLGPDTGDLAIRVGLHSGPVTAGVLRGDKSRFQLFGDTVNTAARIETTGLRNRIHVSHETAELLHAAGKSNWLRRRNETVMAKGKGEMQTFWLVTDEELDANETGDTTKSAPLPIVKAMQPRLGSTAINILDPESTLPPRIKRLVDWNVDVLKRLLKQIVAKRNTSSNQQFELNSHTMMMLEVDIGSDTYVLNEVKEIITLPQFDARSHKLQENPNKIELPQVVEDQLRLYVSSIAAMHRDNPFHNFEHASHVMMSVSKLLSRIVASDEETGNTMTSSRLHDHTYGITSDPLTQFSVILAALIHDVDHSGVSNFQLIKEEAKIATVFKNKSVAEQNSIVLSWERLMESRFAKLRGFIYSEPAELKRFRELMVNTVLATDIFDKELQTLRKERWDKAFRLIGQQTADNTRDDVNRKATIVIEHLIQASDVAHTMQHWHIYQKWNERLFAEMTVAHQSGRMEKNPADGWYQGELGFFDHYIIPLAKKLKECGVFGVSSAESLNYALENRREWSTKGEEAVAKMTEKYSKKEEDESAQQQPGVPSSGGGQSKRRGSIKL
jgi:class 3 adenylate cyclase